jgi:hypothetical protein
MGPPPDWVNPITASAGQFQKDVDPARLLPSRRDLVRIRLEAQRALLLANHVRATPIQVTIGGVIFDGHHAVRAALEEGRLVEILVTPMPIAASAASILDLPVR